MTKFVQQSGVFSVQAGGRSDTPILEVPNLIAGNIVRVTCNFYARVDGSGGRAQGFYFEIKPTKDEAEALTTGGFQGSNSWQSVTKTAFFQVASTGGQPVDDVDFEVVFSAGDLDGEGSLRDFLLYADVVSSGDA